MTLALAATQVAMGLPAPPVVRLRTSAAPSDAHVSSGSAATQAPTVVPASQQPSDTQMAPMKKICTPLALAASISKRLLSETSQGQVPAMPKKRKVVGFSSATVSLSVAGGSTSMSSSAPTGHLIPPAVPVPPVSCSPALSPEVAGAWRLVRTQPIDTSGKRFKPLEIMRPPTATSGDIENAQMSLGLHGGELEGARTKAQLTAIRYRHLDFPAPIAPLALSPITLPPSLAERRLVQRWAIILSGLSEKDRFRCCFVSKLIRYAGKRRLPRTLECMRTQPR